MILLGLFIVGIFVMLFLPETLHQKLPETLREAEQFGKDQSFWYVPRRAHKHHYGFSGESANGGTTATMAKDKDSEVLEKLNQPQFAT